MNQESSIYRFDNFKLDAARRLLFKDEELVTLPPKAYEILLFLVKSGGRIIEKSELMKEIWQDSYVEDNNLTVNITLIRKALNEKSGENKYIVTVPRRGYRFVAEIKEDASLKRSTVTEESEEINVDKEAEILNTNSETSQKPQKLNSLVASKNKTVSRRNIALSAVFISLLIVCSGFIYWNFAAKRIENPSQIHTLAVLPFKSLIPSEQDAILGIGMTDTIIGKLSGIKRITVRPTSTIIKYAVQKKDLNVIGNELGVDALLDGNIQRTGDKLRVSVQLVRVSDGSPLWADAFDAKESDIFALQDSISTQVADSLALRLDDSERRQINKHSTENAEAYKLYLNGVFQLSKRTLESAKRSIAYFEQATEIQPDYAQAYAGLGDAYIMLGNQEALLGGLSPRENIPKAKSALTKALNLDDSLSEAYASMAWVSMWETGESSLASQNLHHALQLNPNSVNAHHYTALLLMSQKEFDQALIEMQKAREIDQFSLVINVNIGTILLRQRRYPEAEAQCRKTLELDPNFPRTHWVLGLVLEQEKRFDEAITEFERAVELTNGGTLAKSSLAHAYAKKGNKQEAEKILAELISKSNENYVSPDAVAAVYTALRNTDKAFEYLEKAVAERQFSMFQLGIEQHFDEIRADSRFQKIESEMQEKPDIKSD